MADRRLWIWVVLLGLTGQLAWTVENIYLNLFVYNTITDSPTVLATLVATSAVDATIATLLAGAASDRTGGRREFIAVGHVPWGLCTAGFGLVSVDAAASLMPMLDAVTIAVIAIVVLDRVMSILGSSANDAAFNAWVTDSTDPGSRGRVDGVLATMPLPAMLLVFGALDPLTRGGQWMLFFTIIGGATAVVKAGKGRNKRWEYWAVTTPTHVVALVVSDIDYAAVHGMWMLDRESGETIAYDAIGLPRSATLPSTLGGGPVRARTKKVWIDIDEIDGGARLRARGERLEIDVLAHRPEGHECLGVVVPWTDRLFQYTVKDVARPATGTIRVDGAVVDVPAGESWATLDHGRGRWPYAVHWNWGAGSGRTDGKVIGIQVGGKWTDGSGSVENALVVDGHPSRISEELVWTYDPCGWMAPWRITGATVDLTFTPIHLKKPVTDLKIFSSRTHQCFGHWSGTVADDTGARVRVEDIVGWAEDVRNRW